MIARGLVDTVVSKTVSPSLLATTQMAVLLDDVTRALLIGVGQRGVHDLIPPPDWIRAVKLAGGRRVFAPMGSDPKTVLRQVCDQEAADDDRSGRHEDASALRYTDMRKRMDGLAMLFLRRLKLNSPGYPALARWRRNPLCALALGLYDASCTRPNRTRHRSPRTRHEACHR